MFWLLRERPARVLMGYALAASALVLSPRIGGAAAVLLPAPVVLFWIVVIGAGLCAVAAAILLWVSHRADAAEQGFLGALLWAVSVLPLVHGLTIPGVLIGENHVTTLSVLLAIPTGAVAAVPLLTPHSRLGRGLGRRWRVLAISHVVLTTALAIAMLADPHGWPAVDPHAPITVALSVVSVAAMGGLALRHLRLHVVSGLGASLLAAFGFVNLAATGLIWYAPAAWTAGWWAVHLVDIAGVFSGIFGLMAATPGDRVRQLLRPVVTHDPLVALELGLTPLIRGMVAELGRKDEITRAHVVRVAELAMRVGERVGLSPGELRTLGLGALLHDIGKVHVPDGVLKKPAALTEAEYSVMKEHSHHGEQMLQHTSVLRDAAPLVRGHHEKWDGTGYPDGLAGEEIPISMGIIAAVDAFDAITHTRQYSRGRSVETAVAILTENIGTQFHPRAVNALVAHIDANGGLDGIDGVFAAAHGQVVEGGPCGHALPPLPLAAEPIHSG